MSTTEEQKNTFISTQCVPYKRICVFFYKNNRKNSKLIKVFDTGLKIVPNKEDFIKCIKDYVELSRKYKDVYFSVGFNIDYRYERQSEHQVIINSHTKNKVYPIEQFINIMINNFIVASLGQSTGLIVGMHHNEDIRKLINEYYHG